MLLEGKRAVIYGGGGGIGGAVARAFGREGATVHLVGRTESTLDAVANDIRDAGGTAETAVFDALDERRLTRTPIRSPPSRAVWTSRSISSRPAMCKAHRSLKCRSPTSSNRFTTSCARRSSRGGLRRAT